MKHVRFAAVLACTTISLIAQQPNSFFSGLTINNIDGPPFPISQNVRRSTTAQFLINGATSLTATGQYFSLYASATGNLSVGAGLYAGDHVDIPLTPAPVTVINSTVNPAFHTDPQSGTFQFSVFVPQSIALNFHAAYQAAITDPTSPAGYSLTAATGVTIVAGPTVTQQPLGDSGSAAITLPSGMTIPFYGSAYSTIYIDADGYLSFGSNPGNDYTPTEGEMHAGPPRIAMFWTDLDQAASGTITTTVDNNPGIGIAPFVKATYVNVGEAYGVPLIHNFECTVDNTGIITLYYPPAQLASAYDQITGITPGNSLPVAGSNPPTPDAMKNLSNLLTPNSYLGAVNEGYYEWFGIAANNQYWTPYPPIPDRPFDLFTRYLNWIPQGVGNLPQSTNRYALY